MDTLKQHRQFQISASEKRDLLFQKLIDHINADDEYEDEEKEILKGILKQEREKLRINSAPSIMHTEPPNKRIRAISVGPKVPALKLNDSDSRSRSRSPDSLSNSGANSHSGSSTPNGKHWGTSSLTPTSSPKLSPNSLSAPTPRGEYPSPKTRTSRHKEGLFGRSKSTDKSEPCALTEPFPFNEENIKYCKSFAKDKWKKDQRNGSCSLLFPIEEEIKLRMEYEILRVIPTDKPYLKLMETCFLVISPNESCSKKIEIYFLEQLGCGDNGTAYRAFDLYNKKFYTAKLFKHENYKGGSETNRGEKEILPNKNRNRLVGICYVKHKSLIILKQYAPGQDLSCLINHSKEINKDKVLYSKLPMDPFFKLKIICGMIREILLFHKCGFLHRDLKPANFIIAKDGSVKLIDEEWAIPLDIITDEHTRVMGTFGYHSRNLMPSTIEERKCFTTISDWYVFGIIIAELISKNCYSKELSELKQYLGVVQHAKIQNMMPDILMDDHNPIASLPTEPVENNTIKDAIYNRFIFPELKNIARQFFTNTKDDDYAYQQVIRLEKLLEYCTSLQQQYQSRQEMDSSIYQTLTELTGINTETFLLFIKDINQFSHNALSDEHRNPNTAP